jgi:hypothetical protein
MLTFSLDVAPWHLLLLQLSHQTLQVVVPRLYLLLLLQLAHEKWSHHKTLVTVLRRVNPQRTA